jgi:F-type H+-transporting ATPase subunit b
MEINATLIGQFITFALLVWVTMRFIWPPIMKAMDERKAKIAEGLAAAEKGVYELELSQHKSAELLRDAKIQAADILDQANKRAGRIIDEAKERAREEGNRLIVLAKTEIDQERETAKQELRKQLASIAISGAEKILQRHIDTSSDHDLLQQLITEI